MNEQIVRDVCLNLLGVEPLAAKVTTDGNQSVVWDVTLPDREVIVRLHSNPQYYSRTENNLMTLRSLGIPVPWVIASDLSASRYDFGVLVLERLPGRDLRHELASLSKDDMSVLAHQIVGFQRAVNALPRGDGFGYVGIGETGPYHSWLDVILSSSQPLPSSRSIPTAVTEAINQTVSLYEPYFRCVSPTCFLDDVTVKNVLVKDGRLSGVIDFDCVCYGDPLYWTGLTVAGIVSDVGTSRLFYGDELNRYMNLSNDQRRIVLMYAAWITASFVDRFAAIETEAWKVRMISAIGRWLDRHEDTAADPLVSI